MTLLTLIGTFMLLVCVSIIVCIFILAGRTKGPWASNQELEQNDFQTLAPSSNPLVEMTDPERPNCFRTEPKLSKEQIAFDRFQNSGQFHPLTCGNDRTSPAHLDGEGILKLREDGVLYCPYCDYIQHSPGLVAMVMDASRISQPRRPSTVHPTKLPQYLAGGEASL